ncbi:hypothetical protein Q3G72_013072 [Acer saccharum]|nr:hypothetical protein Q3G72_013072 [Acer saccharum]
MGGDGGELRYEISQNAYIKLVLYARKHKTAAVNGVLVGRVSPQKNDVVEITDSLHPHSGTDTPLNVTFLRAPSHALLTVNVPLVFRGEDVSPSLTKVPTACTNMYEMGLLSVRARVALLSCCALFCVICSKEARKALLEERPGTNNSTITAMISVKWKEGKQAWNTKAAEAMEAYNKELEKYNNSIAAATDDKHQL